MLGTKKHLIYFFLKPHFYPICSKTSLFCFPQRQFQTKPTVVVDDFEVESQSRAVLVFLVNKGKKYFETNVNFTHAWSIVFSSNQLL